MPSCSRDFAGCGMAAVPLDRCCWQELRLCLRGVAMTKARAAPWTWGEHVLAMAMSWRIEEKESWVLRPSKGGDCTLLSISLQILNAST